MIRVTVWANPPSLCNKLVGTIDDRLAHIRRLGSETVYVQQKVIQEAEVSLIVPPLSEREEYEHRWFSIVITSDYMAEGKTVLADEIRRLFELEGMRVFLEDEVSDRRLREMGQREKERREKDLAECDLHISVHQSGGSVDPKHKARWKK